MEKEIEMRPFVLEEALAGAKVMNGKQEPATDIAYFPSMRGVYKVGVVINENIQYFTVNGIFDNREHDVTRDLFMVPEISEGGINININIGEELGYIVYIKPKKKH
jgi:hypothetical protein